ncbi:MAG: hypothetical protein FWG67_06890 [Defluviitaleaceae bacterium]|nr:hypothetical protein [Defluviitaleaceae bacterium]
MRNRNKVINTLVMAFSLVFLVGAAFAFAPGILDIAGTVNVAAPEYVVWSNVVAGPGFELLRPEGWENNATHTAQIVDARGRTNQRIEWAISFTDAGFADITAAATNESSLHAITITELTHAWSDDELAAAYGLTVDLITTAFVGTTLAPGASAIATVSVEWDGSIPTSDDEPAVNTFIMEFDYELAP